jgi:hypothetical protein
MKYLLATAAVIATLSAAHAESIHDISVYSTTFTSGVPAFQKAFENVHPACQSPANIPACSKALSAGLIGVHDFQQAFVGVRVPECFHSTNSELQHSLMQFGKAFALMKHTFNSGDVSQVNDAVQLLQTGNESMQEAARLSKISTVECLK